MARMLPDIIDAHAPLKVVSLPPANLGALDFRTMKVFPAFNIIETARRNGEIGRDTTVVETSSGTMALGLAIVCMHYGLKLNIFGDRAIEPPLERTCRMSPSERDGQPIDAMIVRWSRVAEPILRRMLAVLGSPTEGKPLGQLIGTTKKIIDRDSGAWNAEHRERFRFLPVALHELDRLDLVNKKGVKHSDGIQLTWAHVVQIHTGIHWVMRALLEAAVGPSSSE